MGKKYANESKREKKDARRKNRGRWKMERQRERRSWRRKRMERRKGGNRRKRGIVEGPLTLSPSDGKIRS